MKINIKAYDDKHCEIFYGERYLGSISYDKLSNRSIINDIGDRLNYRDIVIVAGIMNDVNKHLAKHDSVFFTEKSSTIQ